MEYLHASVLISGGLVVLAWVITSSRLTSEQRSMLMPVQSFTAVALLCTGAMWLIRGPLRVFDGPPLVVIAAVGVSYGAIAGGACLALSKQIPKPVQALVGVLLLFAGVLLLLFQLRVIKPM
jgi:hypothetical protein